jgi:ABC-2 type transport system permease protein
MSMVSVNGSAAVELESQAAERRGPVAFVRDTLLITRRHLLRTWRVPQIIVFSAIMPVVFVLLFRYVFGGAIRVPGYAEYVDYLIPGIVVQTVLFGGSSTAVGMADDLASGITDRLRSLPIHRAAILAARTLADLLRLAYTVALVIAIGLLVGFRFHAGVIPVAEGLGVALLFGYACSWLVFASSIFASPATMPVWLRDFANAQPVTKVVDALRALAEGVGPTTRPALYAIGWSVAILIVAATAATVRFRRG